MKTFKFTRGAMIAALAIGLFLAPSALRAAPPLPGAIFSTDSTCTGVDLNIYGAKSDVYLDGGPAHPGAASLPDGNYYVQVTDPSGACVLGTSVGASDPQPFKVSGGGTIHSCIQLCAVLINGDGACALNGVVDPNCGYNDTPNAGGEYKVWVSTEPTFVDNSTKTDNFKVREGGGGQGDTADLCVRKFYDANVNGIWDTTEVEITGWQFTLFATVGMDTVQIPVTTTPWCSTVDPDTFTAMESDTVGTPIWIHTTPTTVITTVGAGQHGDILFGNVCLGAGGGLTLGFWSNKNGQSLETAADFTLLNGLYLRNAAGLDTNFTGNLTAQKTALNAFLLGANATNMANMLSAQLAAMELNVSHYGVSNKFGAGVNGNSIVSAPGCGNMGLNNQFITINDLMSLAAASIQAHGNTTVAGPDRTYQECLKNALDDANNNRNFVQSGPCSFSFGE